MRRADIVDEHVEAAETLARGAYGLLAPRSGGQVARDAQRVGSADQLELARDSRDAVGVAADHGNMGSGACQCLCTGQPDARRATRDQAAAPLESELHARHPSRGSGPRRGY